MAERENFSLRLFPEIEYTESGESLRLLRWRKYTAYEVFPLKSLWCWRSLRLLLCKRINTANAYSAPTFSGDGEDRDTSDQYYLTVIPFSPAANGMLTEPLSNDSSPCKNLICSGVGKGYFLKSISELLVRIQPPALRG